VTFTLTLTGTSGSTFSSIPLTLKVTQPNGNPGYKDLVCMTNMEKRRPRA
jgi:hypothetical protein